MLKTPVWVAAVLLPLLIPFGNSIGQDFHELKRPYFCSTCFTTTQDQNYHCCFYFFKCCAEARLGSRSTTANPSYPGLPSGVSFFVQNSNAQPCSVDCRDPKEASNVCCRIQGPRNSESRYSGGGEVFKPAFDIQELEMENTEATHQSSTEDRKSSEEDAKLGNAEDEEKPVSEEHTNKAKYQNLGLDITGSPYRLNLKNINSERKLFRAPSLIFDHETEGDSIRGEENWRKRGWYTKDILNPDTKHSE